MKNTFLAILTLSLATSAANGLERSDSVRILFHQGRSEIDTLFQGNSETLMRLDSIFNSPFNHLNQVSIVGAASPEGPVSLNNGLSNHRARNILSLIPDTSIVPDSAISFSFVGRDWVGLYQLAKEDTNLPYKDETLSLLEEINSELAAKPKKGEQESDCFLERLKALRGGIPYRYMYGKLFPLLRASEVYVNYTSLPVPNLTIQSPQTHPYVIPAEPENIVSFSSLSAKQGKNFYMALKTNMLYDVMALPSLSAEFYLGKNFSAVANWTYGWWDTDRTHRYWRAYGGDIAVRWWFGKKAVQKPLTGQHIGIYGGILTYDFEFGGTGYMGGLPHETLWNRSLRMAGIEYGYSLPIARRFNIDFTIGIGYLGGKYIKYIPDGGRYLWQSTHKINWFGPTKAEISLVWLIGNGNYNPSGKGGGK